MVNNLTHCKGNKDAQKWNEADILRIFADTLEHIKKDTTIVYVGEVDLYMMETHDVYPDTRRDWISNTHKTNKRIPNAWKIISSTIENRMVKDKVQVRPNVQNLVLTNKHNFRERQDINLGGQEDNPVKVELTDEQLINRARAEGIDLPPGIKGRVGQEDKKQRA